MADRSWIERHPYLTTAGVVAGTAGLGALAHKLGPGMAAARKAAKAAAKAKKGGSTTKAIKTVKSSIINSFTEELSRIYAEKVAVAIIKDPSDVLDKRTSRHFRKPNPRILPAPMPSGKLVV